MLEAVGRFGNRLLDILELYLTGTLAALWSQVVVVVADLEMIRRRMVTIMQITIISDTSCRRLWIALLAATPWPARCDFTIGAQDDRKD
jgi:hypothetical protein